MLSSSEFKFILTHYEIEIYKTKEFINSHITDNITLIL